MKRAPDSSVYNVIVIGAGTAGLVTAAGTAGLGGRVALIERHKMGGDCLNFGCVPSKALISSARLAYDMAHADEWGLTNESPPIALQNVFARMRARRAAIAPNDSQERFESLGVDVFRGDARFLSPYEVVIGATTLRAKNFVIATGTRAARPAIAGLEQVPYFTNETIFDELNFTPRSIIIIGGGPIGCELSQAFSRLGVDVTLLHNGARLLSKEDPDASEMIENQFKAEGIQVFKTVEPVSCARAGGATKVTYRDSASGKEQAVTAEAILLAAGRTPNLDNLGLENAGVKFSSRGVETNAYLQTTQPHIYAAGDVVGPYQFTHMADYQARIVVRNILLPFGFVRQKIDYSVVPWCTFVSPEVARVGLNETQANERKIEYDLVRQEFSHVDRAVVENAEAGFAKVLLQRGSDSILGVTIVAEHAGELIHEFVLAMKHGLGLGKIAAAIHVYPTMSEVARQAGDQYNKTRLTPFARKLFAWLYRRARA